jgi:glycine/D-amino acid oxidase-like deaminating enzyme
MDLHSTQPFWLLKNGLLGVLPGLSRDEKCDVAIIGGGITGALVADRLVAEGVETVLIDKRDIGQGSSCASTGMLQYEIDVSLCQLADAVGPARAARAYQLGVEAIDSIERLVAELGDPCGFERKKSVYLASHSKDVPDLEREYQSRKNIGLNVDFWSADDVPAHFPFRAPAAILSHDAGQIDAYRLTHRLIERACQRGLRAFDRTAVTKIEPNDDDSVVLHTDRECAIHAHRLVFACGYEAQNYLVQDVSRLISTYAAVSEPVEQLDGWFDQCLIWESSRPYVYLRTTRDGRVLIGGEDVPFRNPELRDRLLSRKTARLVSRFNEMFPGVTFETACAWAGTFGETKDGLAYIGVSSEHPLGYFALGYGGNGITFGVVAADIIRDLHLGRPNADAAIFRFDR